MNEVMLAFMCALLVLALLAFVFLLHQSFGWIAIIIAVLFIGLWVLFTYLIKKYE